MKPRPLTGGINMWDGIQSRPFGDIRQRPTADRPAVHNIPFDYVATFPLTGIAGTLQEGIINISVEGVFVAQEIGYGFFTERFQQTLFRNLGEEQNLLSGATLGNLAPEVLIAGFRFNPTLKRLVFPDGKLSGSTLTFEDAHKMEVLQRLLVDDDLHFLFQIIDSSTGRELQNLPIHNIASLGKSNGERPFRVLAKPVSFLPRATIRIQVEEISFLNRIPDNTGEPIGELMIALHGYKILGVAHIPESQIKAAPVLQRAPAFYGTERATSLILQQIRERRIPRQRLVPYDYVATFDLQGEPGNLLEDEIHINVEGGFITSAIGYSLVTDDRKVLVFEEDDQQKEVLPDIKLSQFPDKALLQGVRIRPQLVSVAFKNGKLSNEQLPKQTINEIFERLNFPDDVRFKFRIIDTGTGRELQNKPELNIAGLGIANGDRPFRELSYPLHLLPRSTIRVQVEEIIGRGRLFIVFQGFKILGG